MAVILAAGVGGGRGALDVGGGEWRATAALVTCSASLLRVGLLLLENGASVGPLPEVRCGVHHVLCVHGGAACLIGLVVLLHRVVDHGQRGYSLVAVDMKTEQQSRSSGWFSPTWAQQMRGGGGARGEEEHGHFVSPLCRSSEDTQCLPTSFSGLSFVLSYLRAVKDTKGERERDRAKGKRDERTKINIPSR